MQSLFVVYIRLVPVLLLLWASAAFAAQPAPAGEAPAAPAAEEGAPALPDDRPLKDRAALDKLQHDTFKYMWDDAHPVSGMAYEANYYWEVRPVAIGGTGFGIAAIVVAADRGWITREEALSRLLTMATFLRDKTPRLQMHGAFPHWLNGETGAALSFGGRDVGADIVETSLLMQGLLIARAYFNGPGEEERLRRIITEIWHDVDWNWFADGGENGIHWHWSTQHGFSGLRILGYNECLITYVLALASPTKPISRKTYDYWTSGKGYQPKDVYGYQLEASLPGGGPLFTAQYSFIGLNPRYMADAFVTKGYFVRNVIQTLSNRSYCLYSAPARNRYSESFWGLTAGNSRSAYIAAEPGTKDPGSIAPTGALSSMPYTPYYSMQVLRAMLERDEEAPAKAEAAPAGARNTDAEVYAKLWGPYGPYDGFSLRDKWVSDKYLAIDQLPIVCMVENYRSGLLWDLFMSDADVREGLSKAGIGEPKLAPGFPEVVVPVRKEKKAYVQDAYDAMRHPDTERYIIPYYVEEAGEVSVTFANAAGTIASFTVEAVQGRNTLDFLPPTTPGDELLTLTLQEPGGREHTLPLRLR